MFFQEPSCHDPQVVFLAYFILATYQVVLWYYVVKQIGDYNWII
jgi:hypothetical protein